jgi:hypothetical protein
MVVKKTEDSDSDEEAQARCVCMHVWTCEYMCVLQRAQDSGTEAAESGMYTCMHYACMWLKGQMMWIATGKQELV